jgi:putative FmdB family regulatory protein
MPLYEYLCDHCGPFAEPRPMAECDDPRDCPECGMLSPRALLTAPRLACMSTSTRAAFAVNERSAHAPQTLGDYKAAQGAAHGSGCGCCSPRRTARPVNKTKRGAKSFPTARPWMISH